MRLPKWVRAQTMAPPLLGWGAVCTIGLFTVVTADNAVRWTIGQGCAGLLALAAGLLASWITRGVEAELEEIRRRARRP